MQEQKRFLTQEEKIDLGGIFLKVIEIEAKKGVSLNKISIDEIFEPCFRLFKIKQGIKKELSIILRKNE